MFADQALTVNADFNPFANTRWNAVLSYTEIRSHVQAWYSGDLQRLGVPFSDWKEEKEINWISQEIERKWDLVRNFHTA